MKKQILLSLLSLFSLSVLAQIPNYVPANGLVGWWPFNGNANDESGNGNNGTVNGATLTNDRFGVVDKAYSFNGAQSIVVQNNALFNMDSNFTISLWFTVNNFSNVRTLINKNSNSNGNKDYFNLGVLPNGGKIYSQFGNGNVIDIIIDPVSPNVNLWYNATLTVSDSVNLFINGINIESHLRTITPLQNNENISMGYWQTQSHTYHYGLLDDIGIWNRALTACEIQNLYTSQLNATFVSAGADQTICNGQQVTLSASNSQNYTWNNGVVDSIPFSPTTTQDYIVNADSANCQSSDTVTVFVNEPTSSTQSATALDSYTWPLNNQIYTQSGTYTATIPNAAGCDSVVTLNLTLNFTGITENLEAQISISPNPASSKINVKSDVALIGSKFIIYDALGKQVKSGQITSIDTEVDLSNLNNGVYLFKIGERQIGTFKIIKE